MNTNSELRNLTDEEVDAVTGAVMCNKVMDNEWSG